MGMLLRRRRNLDNMTTSESFNAEPKEEKRIEVEFEETTVKDKKPKTVRRGRPTKR